MSGMEGDEQRRRQYEQSGYSRGYVPDPRGRAGNAPNTQGIRGAPGGDGSDKYRPTQLLTTRPASSTPLATGAGSVQDMGNFGYVQGQQYATPQMPAGSFQYPPEYAHEPHRQQQYPQYAPQMVYNVPQQPPPQSPYDPVTHYQPRQSAAAEVLSSQFGVQPYYPAGEGAHPSGPGAIPQQYPPASFQQPLQYAPAPDLGRSTLASSYPAMDPGFPQAAGPDAAETPQQEPETYDYAYSQYQQALRATNTNAARGRLVEAGVSLLEISEWLLSHVENLGLFKDDQALHSERLQLWKDFNLCWLALLQRQLDDAKRLRESGRAPAAGQSILPRDSLKRLGDELTRLCDGLEKFGLVDYEMGVWEEEIIGILAQCYDISESDEDDEDEEDDSPEVGVAQAPRQGPGNR